MLAARILGIALCLCWLSGCVTTYDQPKRQINKAAAIEANIKLGMNYIRNGNRDNASRAFFNALKLDSGSAEANQGIALIHQLNGESKEAERYFKKALKGNVSFSISGIYLSYGAFLLERERYSEAELYFGKAARDITYHRRAEAAFQMGLTAFKQNDQKRARGAFEYALNLDPEYAPAALEMADIYFNEGDYAKSKKNLDLYAKNAKQSARSLWLGIRIERIFGNKDKEASYALALKNLHPYSKEYLQYKKLNEQK